VSPSRSLSQSSDGADGSPIKLNVPKASPLMSVPAAVVCDVATEPTPTTTEGNKQQNASEFAADERQILDDDLGIPLIIDGDDPHGGSATPSGSVHSPTTPRDDNSPDKFGYGNLDPNSANKDKTREGRVSFRTQSQENITYPGLQPEPLPPLPSNSTLLKTASYSKPRRKSYDRDLEEANSNTANMPIIGGVNSTSFSNLFNLTSPTKVSGPAQGNINSNMAVINSSTMNLQQLILLPGEQSSVHSNSSGGESNVAGISASLNSSVDSTDGHGSQIQRFDEQTLTLQTLGTNKQGAVPALSTTQNTPRGSSKRPPQIITTTLDSGSSDHYNYVSVSTPTQQGSYMYMQASSNNSYAIAMKTKRRVHALKDDGFVQANSYSPHTSTHSEYSYLDTDIDTDYADEYPVFNVADLEIMEVCGVEMIFADDANLIPVPVVFAKPVGGTSSSSDANVANDAADTEGALFDGGEPSPRKLSLFTHVEDEPVILPITVTSQLGEPVCVLARISSVKTVINNDSQQQSPAKLVSPQPNTNVPARAQTSMSPSVTLSSSPITTYPHSGVKGSSPAPVASQQQQQQAVGKSPLPPLPPPHVSSVSPVKLLDKHAIREPQYANFSGSISADVLEGEDAAVAASDPDGCVQHYRIDKVFEESNSSQPLEFMEASPMQVVIASARGMFLEIWPDEIKREQFWYTDPLDQPHTPHTHGNNVLLSSHSGKQANGALALKHNKQHIHHLHAHGNPTLFGAPSVAVNNATRRASIFIANMKLNPQARKVKASVQFMQTLGKLAGGRAFAHKCHAFFHWYDCTSQAETDAAVCATTTQSIGG
jgi:hypothetical protein